MNLQLVLLALVASLSLVQAQDPWLVYPGSDGPGKGRHIVLIAGEESYRSEESMPLLARILSRHHGFKCTVLFSIDSKDNTINPMINDNIPGLQALESADLMILFCRWRELPDEQMKRMVDYAESGKPIIGIRNATHPFRYDKHRDSPYARFDSGSKNPPGGWGRLVLGETWVSQGMEQQIPPISKVDLVGTYNPGPVGGKGLKKGVKPADLAW